MACRYKSAVSKTLSLFRSVSGVNVSKDDWHAYRNEAEKAALDRGDTFTTARVSDQAKLDALRNRFAATLNLDDEQKGLLESSLNLGDVTQSQYETFNVMLDKLDAGEKVGTRARSSMLRDTLTWSDHLDHAGFYETDKNGKRVARPHREVEDGGDPLPAVASHHPSHEVVERVREWLGYSNQTVVRGFSGDTGVAFTLAGEHDRSFAIRVNPRRGKNPITYTVLISDQSHKANGFDQYVATERNLADVDEVEAALNRFAPVVSVPKAA